VDFESLMLSKQLNSICSGALLILLFVGQTLAAVAMPCQLMEIAPVNHGMVMASMDHSMMGMHQDVSDMNTADKTRNSSTLHSDAQFHPQPDDCCKTEGHCSSGSCSSALLSFLPSFVIQSSTALNSPGYHQHIPNSYIPALFRPPIFC